MCSPDCFLFVIAILFPPLPVWVKRGILSSDSIINIALCVLGFLPGLFHAWYIIAKYPDPFDGAYAYVRVDEEAQPGPHRCGRHQPPRQGGLVYGQHQPPLHSERPQGYGSFNVTSAPEPRYGPSQAGSSSQQLPGEPPSYASVVKGDHKIQHD